MESRHFESMSYNTITPLVATFSKTTGLSSRKYVSQQGMSIPQ